MHIHILGICGTFMGSLAILAKELGFRVSGSDQNIYPPMSTQLIEQGIELHDGYELKHLDPLPDQVVIGNALSRGNPMVEHILNNGLPYISGPQWLAQHVLKGRWVLAVSGTHGKTTTSSMLAWVLEQAGLTPGFLIGGVPLGFKSSARLGESAFFVIEADEYDTAFFDKRSKFVHYQPRTLVINNLEFDHADIFKDLAAIQTQFHHLLRIVPGQGEIITPSGVEAIEQTIERGIWSTRKTFAVVNQVKAGNQQAAAESAAAQLVAHCTKADGSEFDVSLEGKQMGRVSWSLSGIHNVENALAALLAARHIGVRPEHGISALNRFSGVKRRLEKLADHHGIVVYDDFAHHPTAIQSTLEGLRHQVGKDTIWAVIEPRSNTMKMGVHQQSLLQSAEAADRVLWANFQRYPWLDEAVSNAQGTHQIYHELASLERQLDEAEKPTHIVLMSNGGFQGLPQRMQEKLQQPKA